MVDRRNSTDANFLFDSSLQNDHLKEDNAIIASDNEIRLATFTNSAYPHAIGEGLVLSDGTNPGTVRISAGWAIDDLGRKITVPVALNNIALLDTGGGINYIAIRYSNTYSAPRVARGNGVEYNTTIQDSYITDVALAQQVYGMPDYWIRLGVATRVGAGTGLYGMKAVLRTLPWRQKDPIWSRTFGWHNADAKHTTLAIPATETWLYHQGVNSEIMNAGFAGYVKYLGIRTSAAPGGAITITWRVRIAGAVAFSLVQGAAVTNMSVTFSHPEALALYSFTAEQPIHVTAQASASSTPSAAMHAIAVINGGITGW